MRVDVGDTGYGIPGEIPERVYEPFFSTKCIEGRRGTGLGMSIVQAVILDHDGRIDMESEVGRGTTFSAHLPGRVPEATC